MKKVSILRFFLKLSDQKSSDYSRIVFFLYKFWDQSQDSNILNFVFNLEFWDSDFSQYSESEFWLCEFWF